jgi:hypothetical protein
MNVRKTDFWVLLLFVGITIIQLYPLSLQPASGVRDAGDPLLNSWIMAWVNFQIFHRPLDLFQANMFYPYRNTLAFSEHLLPLALISAPVYFLSNNPVLAHNFALFLAFVLNAYAVFLLLRRLTGSPEGAVLGGIAFAFSSFKIMHFSHVQLLWSMGIPFMFFFLHKFLDDRKWRDSILFSIFFLFQGLACVYYGLFSAAILGLLLPLLLVFHFRKLDGAFFLKLALPLGLAGGVLYLFSLPYAQVFRTMGLKRGLAFGAEVQNYAAAFPTNRLFGGLSSGWGGSEKYLFPGVIVLILAAVAVTATRKMLPRVGGGTAARRAGRIVRILIVVFAAVNLLSLVVALLGGFTVGWGKLKISVNNPVKPALYLFLLGIPFFAAKAVRFLRSPAKPGRTLWILSYSILAFWAMMLSFGAAFTFLGKSTMVVPMPFPFFYRRVIGFNGIREPVRFAVFVLFGVCVLAGFGGAWLMGKVKRKSVRIALFGALILAMNVEYLAGPIDGITVPVGKNIPPVYGWLKDQPRDAVILELPFHEWIPDDSIYLYFSTFHRKKIVNGYSGFIPASTFFLKDVFREFPGEESLDMLEALGVDLVLVHAKMLAPESVQNILARTETDSLGRLRLLKRFQYGFSKPNSLESELGDDLVLSFRPGAAAAGTEQGIAPPPLRKISPIGWKLVVYRNPGESPNLADDDLSSNWSSGEMKHPGQYIEVDFGQVLDVAEVMLFSGPAYYEYGADYRLEASDDGLNWRPVLSRFLKAEFLRSLIRDQSRAGQEIVLEDGRARFLKIIQTGKSADFVWSVAEVRIFERAASPPS